jgi:hypothetical protein
MRPWFIDDRLFSKPDCFINITAPKKKKKIKVGRGNRNATEELYITARLCCCSEIRIKDEQTQFGPHTWGGCGSAIDCVCA